MKENYMYLLAKLSSVLLLATSIYLHGMKVEKASETFQHVTLQPDPRLLLELPKELIHSIIKYTRTNTFDDIEWLIKFSCVRKKHTYLRQLNTIKTLLDIDQKNLDLYLLYLSRFAHKHHPVSCIKLLLDMGANVNVSQNGIDPSDYTNHPYFKRLFLINFPHIEQEDTIGKTPLYWAIKFGAIDLAKLLIEYKADIHVTDRNKYSLIALAMIWNNSKGVKLLIENGIDTSTVYNLGNYNTTISEWANMADHEDIYTAVTGQKMPQSLPWYLDALYDIKKDVTEKVGNLLEFYTT